MMSGAILLADPQTLITEMAHPFSAPAEGELPNFNIYQELPQKLKEKDHFIETLQILPEVIPAMHHASFGVVPLPPGRKIGTGEVWPGGPVLPGALLDSKTGNSAGAEVTSTKVVEPKRQKRGPVRIISGPRDSVVTFQGAASCTSGRELANFSRRMVRLFGVCTTQ